MLDTRDDRKEIHQLLSKLSPARRIAFLSWCLKQCCQPIMGGPGRPREESRVARKTIALAEKARWDSSADDRLTREAYTDCWFMALNHKLDLDKALEKLVEMVRKRAS